MGLFGKEWSFDDDSVIMSHLLYEIRESRLTLFMSPGISTTNVPLLTNHVSQN